MHFLHKCAQQKPVLSSIHAALHPVPQPVVHWISCPTSKPGPSLPSSLVCLPAANSLPWQRPARVRLWCSSRFDVWLCGAMATPRSDHMTGCGVERFLRCNNVVGDVCRGYFLMQIKIILPRMINNQYWRLGLVCWINGLRWQNDIQSWDCCITKSG